MGADIRHGVEFAPCCVAQGGDDHAGERAVAAVQRARQVDVPLPDQRADRARTDEHLAVVEDPLRQGAEVIPVTDLAADPLRHGAVANGAAIVGDEYVGADLVQQHEVAAPGQQAEVVGIGLPGMGKDTQRLVRLEQFDPDLLLEQCRLARHAGLDARGGGGAFGERGADRAEPGECDQDHGGGDNADQPHGGADARPVHRGGTFEAIPSPVEAVAVQSTAISPA